MSLNVSSTASSLSSQGSVQKPQSSSVNPSNLQKKSSQNPDNASAGKPDVSPDNMISQEFQQIQDNVSLQQPQENQGSKPEISVKNTPSQVGEKRELDSESSLKALRKVRENILKKTDVSILSQANNRPETASDLLNIIQS